MPAGLVLQPTHAFLITEPPFSGRGTVQEACRAAVSASARVLDMPDLCPAEYDVCDVRHKRFDDEACKKLFPEAYAITYWTHSWG